MSWPGTASAQLNVERTRPQTHAPGLTGKLQLSFGLKQGNVNLINAGFTANLAYEHKRHLLFVLGDSQFAAQSLAREGGTIQDLGDADDRFKNRHMAHVRYNVRVARWLILEAFTQIETDEFLLVTSRFLMGAGLRFVLWENDDFGAYLGSAYMPEREALEEERFIWQPGNHGSMNWWHRWSNYVSLETSVDDRLALRNVIYLQPRFDELGDMRLLNQAELEVSLTKRLGLKLITSLTFDSRPPTYCGELPDEGPPCPASQIVTLQPTDVALQNAFTYAF